MEDFPLQTVFPDLLVSLCNIIVFLVAKTQDSVNVDFPFSSFFHIQSVAKSCCFSHFFGTGNIVLHHTPQTSWRPPNWPLSFLFFSLQSIFIRFFYFFSPIKCSDHVTSSGWRFQWVFVPIRVLNCRQQKWTLVHLSRREISWNDIRKHTKLTWSLQNQAREIVRNQERLRNQNLSQVLP